MAALTLQGSSVPLDHGGFVVTVVCPNHYSHQRLMQALLSIVPDAGEPSAVSPAMADARAVTPTLRDPEQDDDEGLPADFTQCRVGGGCE